MFHFLVLLIHAVVRVIGWKKAVLRSNLARVDAPHKHADILPVQT
jgi:hypothetical protein